MKKIFFAGFLMVVTLAACNTSDTSGHDTNNTSTKAGASIVGDSSGSIADSTANSINSKIITRQ